MYDTILLPTDGKAASKRATEQAVELAATVDATIHALFVVDEEVYSAYSGDEFVAEEEGPEHGLEELGEETLAAVRDHAETAGVEIVTEMEHGTPEDAILDYANDHEVDLLVMGTKEHPEPYRRMLGSVTNSVVQTISHPVMIVKTPADE
jgi:nucleotide-binding universal stress UspA family protein